MKASGILDGFPIHLLGRWSQAGTTLIIDSPALGLLQVQPVPDGARTTFVASPEPGLLEQTRASAAIGWYRNYHLVLLSNRGWLPFRDGSVDEIVYLDVGSQTNGSSGLPDFWPEYLRLLSPVGKLICIVPQRAGDARADGFPHQAEMLAETYHARPLVASRYYVTRDWLPAQWPFKSLQIGKVESIRMGVDLLAGRLGLPCLMGGARITVYSRAACDRNTLAASDYIRCIQSKNDAGLLVKAQRNAILMGSDGSFGSGSSVVVKFPLIGWAATTLSNHASSLKKINRELGNKFNELLPQVVDAGTFNGQAYVAETRCEGAVGSTARWKPRKLRKVIRVGAEFLRDFHSATRQTTPLTKARFQELLLPTVDYLETRGRKVESSFTLADLVAGLWAHLGNREVPMVRTHGDFCPENLLVSYAGELTGVVDWELSMENGWPLLDLLNLFILKDKRASNEHLARLVLARLLPFRLPRWQREMIKMYCKTIGVDLNLHPALVTLYWLERARWMAIFCDDKWVERNVVAPAPLFLNRLRAPYGSPGAIPLESA